MSKTDMPLEPDVRAAKRRRRFLTSRSILPCVSNASGVNECFIARALARYFLVFLAMAVLIAQLCDPELRLSQLGAQGLMTVTSVWMGGQMPG